MRVSVFAFWRFSLLSKKDYCVETGADIYFTTTTKQTITMSFNGRVLKATNWKSNTEGVNVMVFE